MVDSRCSLKPPSVRFAPQGLAPVNLIHVLTLEFILLMSSIPTHFSLALIPAGRPVSETLNHSIQRSAPLLVQQSFKMRSALSYPPFLQ